MSDAHQHLGLGNLRIEETGGCGTDTSSSGSNMPGASRAKVGVRGITSGMSGTAGIPKTMLSSGTGGFASVDVPGTVAANLQVPDRLKFEVDEDVEATSEKKGDEDDSNTIFKEFEEWLLTNGAKFPDLYLKRYGDSEVRGVHATRPIAPYNCIIQIPLKCLITDEMGRETEMGRKLFSQNYSLSTPNLIAVLLYIMETREDPNHFFQPYYRVLPRKYDDFPIFYNDEQLSWLTGSPLLDDIAERKRNMHADYEEICRLVPEFERFSFEEFLEVRTAVGSRNFGILVHNHKRTAMVPYSDMLNHYRPRETSWTFEDSKDAFTITSLSSLQPHQQVMDSYGKKCNSKFLLHYGFAVVDNREEDGKCQNEIYIRLHLASARQDSLHESRLAVLGPSRSSRGFRLSMNIEDKATSEALSYCRVAVATADELTEILAARGLDDSGAGDDGHGHSYRRSRDSYRDSSVGYVSARNETAALEMLAAACERQLTKYPQTYEENLELLNHGNLKPFSVRRTTLIVVVSEQEILSFWIHAFETLSAILQDSSNEAPLHQRLRQLPDRTHRDADLARFAGRLAYEIRMAAPARR
ncbi:Histone-lysine N-methyltransferase setd3 [Hondaea fermentalgiana]|uniref:Histone-lysine N-methyltransferase setd3 n=1 Tax=Hondaea fermentalgiana TaxID=2315210 RepID=A0A2R5GFL8_9STRA|nr:Histone-lysine N-methyltransferase setd3 [Hondaea fermentalgiana]|eukprot:GBG29720.1 Histone-lysine N-methyltransferase setd3 [Hondaea fermentalgiana]